MIPARRKRECQTSVCRSRLAAVPNTLSQGTAGRPFLRCWRSPQAICTLRNAAPPAAPEALPLGAPHCSQAFMVDGIVRENARLLRRVIISQLDLQQAAEFAERLVRLTEVASTENVLERQAWSMALIVSYARPFSHNQSAAVATRQLKLETIGVQLTPSERALHDRIVAFRDTEIAHSDTDAHSIEITIRDGVAHPLSRATWHPLPLSDARGLVSLIEKLRRKLSAAHLRLQARLPEGRLC